MRLRGLGLLYDNKGHQLIVATANGDSLRILTPEDKLAGKILYAKAGDCFADIIFKNGVRRKQEFYYGSGYLSQQDRSMEVSEGMKEIWICNNNGRRRKVYEAK